MKTSNKLTSETILDVIKESFYALRILLIAMAIPVLSYMELSHKDNKSEPSSEKNIGISPGAKANTVAYK